MTSIERTAYPHLNRLSVGGDWSSFDPDESDLRWARKYARTDGHLLSLLLELKSFESLGYFPGSLEDVPKIAVDRVRSVLEVSVNLMPEQDSDRTGRWQRSRVRERLGVEYEPERARRIAEESIRSAALVKNNPPDLINVAIEMLVKESLELPSFRFLNDAASRIRTEVNASIFQIIQSRIDVVSHARLDGLLEAIGTGQKTGFNQLKRVPGRASWSTFREQVRHLEWVDGLGDTEAWLEGIAESKIADFAGEAAAADAAVMGDVAPLKRTTLLACLVHAARTRALDDLTEMFCKRIASITKRAKTELEEIRTRQAEMSERLIETYRDVLLEMDPRNPAGGTATKALARARKRVEAVGGFDAELADISAVSSHHQNNYVPLVSGHWKMDRSTMFSFVSVVDFEATSADRRVLDAIEHAVAYSHLTRDFIPDHVDGLIVDLSFASDQWRRIILSPDHPNRLHRRHFEAAVFSYLAEELRTGDVAVRGSEAYASWLSQLLPWEVCEPLLAEFCTEVGLPGDAREFTTQLQTMLTDKANEVDAGYPENADLVIDENGRPSLKRRRGKDLTPSAKHLEATIKERLPERSLLEILGRTAYWLGWWRRFGPASGSDPKLKAPLIRYVLTTFTYGCNIGPAQAARHIRGVSAHELGSTAQRHFTIDKLDTASADVINKFQALDLTKVWGDGSSVAADGTQIDTWENNLLAESHIRYGGYGGIAYHHIANNYIALFSRFVPCGVWEAVYILDGLLQNKSDVHPDTIHADTQGQNYPVHALSYLLGFDLLPRIRNWKDLNFYRPTASSKYDHIDSLFGKDTINWPLIETHWQSLMQVVLSIREGRLSSTLLLRRLRTESYKNNIYKAFRELGRVLRTITLLRFISDPPLRAAITGATNKVEAYNDFSDWLSFGHEGIERNDPDEQEKIVKFNTLLANCVMFNTALDISAVVRDLIQEGLTIKEEDLAIVTPYVRERIKRFGDYATEGLDIPPEDFNPNLHLDNRIDLTNQDDQLLQRTNIL